MDVFTGDGAGGISIIGVIAIVVFFLFSKMRGGGRGGGISLPGRGPQAPSSPSRPAAPRQRPASGSKPSSRSGGSGAGDLVRDLEESGKAKKEG